VAWKELRIISRIRGIEEEQSVSLCPLEVSHLLLLLGILHGKDCPGERE
jgi:hypothetical protein